MREFIIDEFTKIHGTADKLPELIRCANCKHCGLARYNDGTEHRPYLYTYVCHRFEELFEGQRFEVDFDDYCRWAERETL